MKAFEYASAASPSSAVDLRGADGRFLAGGIDLLGEMKEYIVSPNRVVNIKKLPGTSAIEARPEGGFRIGANATVAQIAAHPELQKAYPGLTEAASEVGSPQIRRVATAGGNLAQHSRCWYFRQRDVTCLKRGGSTCYARDGQNKYHAIFSGNPCISPVVSNLAVALAALGASVTVFRDDQETPLTIEQLYSDAWSNPLAQNSLRPDDIITRIDLPATTARSTYMQVSEKGDFDWALVSCSAAGTVTDGKLSGVRVVLGAVSPTPFEVPAATRSLDGKTIDAQLAAAVADEILKGAKPLAHNAYKAPIAKTLIKRTLLKLVA